MNHSLTRKEFLRISGSGVSATVLALGLPGCAVLSRPLPQTDILLFDSGEIEVLQKLLERMVGLPNHGADSAQLLAATMQTFGQILLSFQAELPNLVADFRSALLLFEYAPIVFHFKFSRFSRLTPLEQDEILEDWMLTDTKLKKDIFIAFKALSTIAYYEQPTVFLGIGYEQPWVSRSAIEGALDG